MENLFNFINNSISPFHAVVECEKLLKDAGFIRLFENKTYNLENGHGYYVVRNDASIIAFVMPNKEVKSFKIVSSHLDSPTFKIKPNGELEMARLKMLNTEVYGGPIMSSWFDRSLGISGRVFIEENNKIVKKLVDIKNACVIPNIAIHLNREVNSGYKYNPQIDLLPIYGQKASFNLFLEDYLNVSMDQIKGTDLFLYNSDKATTVGLDEEFFVAPRIDNLECAYTSLAAFIKNYNNKTLSNDTSCHVYASFNHEEVGSSSDHGAASTFLIDTLTRILNNNNVHEVLASSIMLSADNAHAVHPAASSKADPVNKVYMNSGIVIKNASNLSYTTDGYSKSIVKAIWDKENVAYQEFTNNSALRGGSTLGCISLHHVSITSIDIGLAQLAMHSANETAGTKDVENMIKGIKAFYDKEIIKTEEEVSIN